eukprot:1309259-Prymnesium_polylepis.1
MDDVAPPVALSGLTDIRESFPIAPVSPQAPSPPPLGLPGFITISSIQQLRAAIARTPSNGSLAAFVPEGVVLDVASWFQPGHVSHVDGCCHCAAACARRSALCTYNDSPVTAAAAAPTAAPTTAPVASAATSAG